MSKTVSEHDLSLAHDLVDIAAEIALRYFGDNQTVSKKHDGTPVAEADLDIESTLLNILQRERPNDAVFSEEHGVRGSGNRRWIIDPIDGTRNFIAGNLSWGTHIALQADEILLGVISRPLFPRRWWATLGGGAYVSTSNSREDGRSISVSSNQELAESRITFWPPERMSMVKDLQKNSLWTEPNFESILNVAEGSLEACIDATGKAWDLAPYVRIVEEAGGTFSDLSGGHSIEQGGCFSNGKIHAQLLQAISA